MKKPNFNYHLKCEKLGITRICFADNLILFSRGDEISVKLIMEEFHSFSKATSMKVNPTKCKVYFGRVLDKVHQNIRETTNFSNGTLPFKYLGVPLSSRKLIMHQYRPLMDKIIARMKHWTAKLLSHTSMKQLINNVIFVIIMYWIQVFLSPRKLFRILKLDEEVFFGVALRRLKGKVM